MKYETALRILKKRAREFYGMQDQFNEYILLVDNCGGTKREVEALEVYKKKQLKDIQRGNC